MNIWRDIEEERIGIDEFIACVEISKGSKMKYELDKPTGRLILDRVLFTSTHYPQNYGFIPRTYAGDNDPLDVLVLCTEPIVPLCLVKCYPIGVIKMIDSEMADEKIIAICSHDPSLNCYKNIHELAPHLLDEIKHFFQVYKQLEGKTTYVTEILGVDEAKMIIKEAINNYKDKFGK
ncbi:MAG: inorganic diphosphatase [Bacillales bacterium]|nr:inorganic diphosphatase [Bacillales bacterium]